MGKRKNYESPFIERAQVETESGFCAASVIEKPNDGGTNVEGHEVGSEIDASKPESGWDDNWY